MVTAKNEKLNRELFEITTGILLGDANLQKPKGCRYYRLRFSQNSKREDYVQCVLKKYKNGLIDSKNNFFNDLVKRDQPGCYQYTTIKGLKHFSFNFETRIWSSFNQHANIFYAQGSSKKELCSDLEWFDNNLTANSLAYWYINDGTWPNKASKSFMLCTHGLTVMQAKYFSNLLNKKWHLTTKVQFNKQQPIIRIGAKSFDKFKTLIYPVISQFSSMKSKFPIE